MVAGGRTPLLHMWDLTSHQLMKAVELPGGVREVRQLIFPPHSWDGGTSKVYTHTLYAHADTRYTCLPSTCTLCSMVTGVHT